VINHDSTEYVKSKDEFVPIDGSLEAIARLHKAGFKIGICTNQSAIGRGLLSQDTLAEIHRQLHRAVAVLGGHIGGLCYCPHLPDHGCICRKPRPGMLQELMQRLKEPPELTVFVGDSLKDLQAARNAGCQPVLVRTGQGRVTEAAAAALGVVRIYDDLAGFASAEIRALRASQAAQQ